MKDGVGQRIERDRWLRRFTRRAPGTGHLFIDCCVIVLARDLMGSAFVVRFEGAVIAQEPMCILMELMDTVNLYQYITNPDNRITEQVNGDQRFSGSAGQCSRWMQLFNEATMAR